MRANAKSLLAHAGRALPLSADRLFLNASCYAANAPLRLPCSPISRTVARPPPILHMQLFRCSCQMLDQCVYNSTFCCPPKGRLNYPLPTPCSLHPTRVSAFKALDRLRLGERVSA
eukprot:785821-Pleurochrysis_carterae.AAC.1